MIESNKKDIKKADSATSEIRLYSILGKNSAYQ